MKWQFFRGVIFCITRQRGKGFGNEESEMGIFDKKELFINNLGGINLMLFDNDAPSVSKIFIFLFATQ